LLLILFTAQSQVQELFLLLLEQAALAAQEQAQALQALRAQTAFPALSSKSRTDLGYLDFHKIYSLTW
jgi:hypothetical protein